MATNGRLPHVSMMSTETIAPGRRAEPVDGIQEIMGAWGGGSYLKTVAKNLETARVTKPAKGRKFARRARVARMVPHSGRHNGDGAKGRSRSGRRGNDTGRWQQPLDMSCGSHGSSDAPHIRRLGRWPRDDGDTSSARPKPCPRGDLEKGGPVHR